MKYLALKKMESVMRKAGHPAFNSFEVLMKVFGILGSLLAVCVMSGAVAFFDPRGLKAFAEASSSGMPGIQILYEIGRSMVVIDAAENALLATDIDEKKRQSIYSQFDRTRTKIDELRKAYESFPRSPEETGIWKKFVRAMDRWNGDHEEFIRLARAHEKSRTPQTYKGMSAQALEVNPASLSAAVSLLNAAIEVSLERLKEKSKIDGGTSASSYQEYTGFIIVSGMAVAAVAVVLLSISLRRRQRRERRLVLDVGNYPPVIPPARPPAKSS